MSRRRISSLVAGSLAVAALGALPLSTASAEPTSTPGADDVVGVGSDTIQYALDNLVDGATVNGQAVPGWNASHTPKMASFDTVDANGQVMTDTITPKVGAPSVKRPDGSGAGKALLYGAGNNPGVNFARSSSALNDAEKAANLWAVPFAVDGLQMAVDKTDTAAPGAVTIGDIVKIYSGTVTNWKDLGGKDAPIHALIPQSGSGTRSFFESLMTAANGGNKVAYGPGVKETQEHSDKDIKDDPDAIAPFSTARAKAKASTIKLLADSDHGGFSAKRALYNVVRQADLTAPWFAPIFGTDGFICSPAAQPLIEAAGFPQMASVANGGACGRATQSAEQNFTVNAPKVTQDTTTQLTASARGQRVTLTATVKAPIGTPAGTVAFFDGTKKVGASNLSGGVGLLTLTATAGSHAYKAAFTPADASAFRASQGAKALVVKMASRTGVTVPAKFSATKRVKAAISVVAAGKPAAGKVAIANGAKRIMTVSLVRGKAAALLPKLTRGKHALSFSYLGNAKTAASKAVRTVTVTR